MRFIPLAAAVALALSACGGGDGGSGGAPDAMPSPADAQTPTWNSFAQGFFETYCWECHGPGDQLRDYSELSMVRAEAETIKSGVDSEQFPVGDGPKPTREERDELILWIELGAPE